MQMLNERAIELLALQNYQIIGYYSIDFYIFIYQRIRRSHLLPPSTQAYNLKAPGVDPSRGQSDAIKQILGSNYVSSAMK